MILKSQYAVLLNFAEVIKNLSCIKIAAKVDVYDNIEDDGSNEGNKALSEPKEPLTYPIKSKCNFSGVKPTLKQYK